MICPVCGASNESGSRYCNTCGAAFLPNNALRREKMKKRRIIKAIKTALLFIIFSLLLSITFFIVKYVVLPPIYRYSYCDSRIFTVESAEINAEMNDLFQDAIIKKDTNYKNGYQEEVFTLVDIKSCNVSTFTEFSLLADPNDDVYIYDNGRQLQISYISLGANYTLHFEKASFFERVKALSIIQISNISE